jgi:predicted NUDIX family phosphoesterase
MTALDVRVGGSLLSAAMKTGRPEEMVLVIRRSLFDRLGAFQGLNFDVGRYLPAILSRENNFFAPRSAAEQDPSLKQIIPYALLAHDGKVLHYVRGKKAGEQRLVAKGSIGIGGHLNDADENLFSLDEHSYLSGVRREVEEEITVGCEYENTVRGILNDDSTEVGRVHLGIIHVFKLQSAEVTKREAMITQLSFLSPGELEERRDTLETWSQICLDQLGPLLGVAEA